MGDEVDRRAGDDRGDLGAAQRLAGVGDHQLVADRRDDDPGDEHDVQVRVGVARHARAVGGHLQPPLGDPHDVGEVQPPQRRGDEERGGERGERRRVEPAVLIVAPVRTIDSPSAMMMNSPKRSAKWAVLTCHAVSPMNERPGIQNSASGAAVVDRQRDEPQGRAGRAAGDRAGDPEHAGGDEPREDARRPLALDGPAARPRRRSGTCAGRPGSRGRRRRTARPCPRTPPGSPRP